MGCCLGAIGALMLPRILMIVLYFCAWFEGVFDTKLWPILGFIFMPVTTLWYACIANWYGGVFMTWHVVVMILAVIIDLGLLGGSSSSTSR